LHLELESVFRRGRKNIFSAYGDRKEGYSPQVAMGGIYAALRVGT